MGRKADAGTESFGALLRRYRGRLGLTQQELAERAGLYAQQISQLERDVVRRPRSTTVEFLADALKLDAQERAAFVAAARGEWASSTRDPIEDSEQVLPTPVSLADAESLLASMPTDAVPPRGALPAGSRMPLAANPLFVGRGDELLQVARALRGGDATVALGQVVASTGLGGLGKTQLAVELVHRYGRFFAGGVFWLSFASADEIPLQVAAGAGPGAMDLAPGIESLPLEERVQRVQRAWQDAVPRLLVFDNCEEETLLDAWRPSSGGCRLLVTSRRSGWLPTLGITALPLDLLPRADSIELLRRYRPDLVPDDTGLDAIAKELGDLPLALHLAGSYLRTYRAEVSLDGYVTELRRADVVQHASLLGAGLDDSPSPTYHVQSVAQTFALCLGRLDRDSEVDRVAIALLARMACMAPGEPVPRDLLGRTLEDVDPRRRADGLRRLGAVGLVEEGEGWLRLHRLLVHFVRQNSQDPEAQAAVNRALIRYTDAIWEYRLTESTLMAMLPHLVAVASRESDDQRGHAALCRATGLALLRSGDSRAGRPWLERTAAIREALLGPGHPEVADSLNELAELLWLGGNLAEARPLFERALQIRERALGPDHAATAESLHNLAIALRHNGEAAASRPMLECALAICERELGPDHVFTAQVLGNLANHLRLEGDMATARPLAERALTIHERVLGPENAVTAWALENLGVLLREQGELAAAEPLLERALNICERVKGPDDRDTARSLHNLALLFRDQGDPAAARPLFERALAIRERVLGPDHPDTVATRRALAELAAEDGPAAGGC